MSCGQESKEDVKKNPYFINKDVKLKGFNDNFIDDQIVTFNIRSDYSFLLDKKQIFFSLLPRIDGDFSYEMIFRMNGDLNIQYLNKRAIFFNNGEKNSSELYYYEGISNNTYGHYHSSIRRKDSSSFLIELTDNETTLDFHGLLFNDDSLFAISYKTYLNETEFNYDITYGEVIEYDKETKTMNSTCSFRNKTPYLSSDIDNLYNAKMGVRRPNVRPSNYDLNHINYLSWWDNEHYLVSQRTLSQISLVNKNTCEILWTIDGDTPSLSDFSIENDPEGGFYYQHSSAVFREDGKTFLYLFDNGVPNENTRVVLYEMDFENKKMLYMKEYSISDNYNNYIADVTGNVTKTDYGYILSSGISFLELGKAPRIIVLNHNFEEIANLDIKSDPIKSYLIYSVLDYGESNE